MRLLLWLFVVISFSCSTSKQKELSKAERAMMYVDAATSALAEGKFADSMQFLAEAEAAEPHLPQIHHIKSLTYFARKDLRNAMEAEKRAVELAPDYMDAHTTLGKYYYDQGNYAAAMPHLKKAAKDPTYRDAFKPLTLIALIEFKRKNFLKAEEYFDQAIISSSNEACIAYYYKGKIEENRKNLKAAIENYGSATQRICANYSEAHLAIAGAFLRDRQIERAKKKYLEVSERFPNTEVAKAALSALRTLP